MQRIRNFIIALICLAITMVLAFTGIVWIVIMFGHRFPADFITHLWAKIMCSMLGVRYEITGRENLSKHRPCLIISNHQSMLDVFILCAILPYKTVFVAKKELFKIPLFGVVFSIFGHIYIDRHDHRRAVSALDKAVNKIKEKGYSIIMFPEGTRSKDGRILEFKAGMMRIINETYIPLVCVIMYGTGKIIEAGSLGAKKGALAKVEILEPIETSSWEASGTDAGRLKEIKEIYVKKMDEYLKQDVYF